MVTPLTVVVVVACGADDVVVVAYGMVSPGMVVDGITTSATNESSVNLAGKHAPGLTGAVPRAAAMDDTNTARPAFVGCTRSLFSKPGCTDEVPQSRMDT